MKRRFLTILTVAAALFYSCNKSDKPVPDNIGPDVSGIPELPADPQPGSTNFNHRIMLLQHTGTYCPNCPNLMSSLKEVAQDNGYNDRYVHVASHSYNQEGDAAYSDAGKDIAGLLQRLLSRTDLQPDDRKHRHIDSRRYYQGKDRRPA